MTDKPCKELAFPVLSPRGRRGFTKERDVKLSPAKDFQARLLHHKSALQQT